MKAAVKDTLFLGPCLLVIIAASFLLYYDFNRILDRSSTEKIGKIVFKKDSLNGNSLRRFSGEKLKTTPLYIILIQYALMRILWLLSTLITELR
jgi:hypothetical protein